MDSKNQTDDYRGARAGEAIVGSLAASVAAVGAKKCIDADLDFHGRQSGAMNSLSLYEKAANNILVNPGQVDRSPVSQLRNGILGLSEREELPFKEAQREELSDLSEKLYKQVNTFNVRKEDIGKKMSDYQQKGVREVVSETQVALHDIRNDGVSNLHLYEVGGMAAVLLTAVAAGFALNRIYRTILGPPKPVKSSGIAGN